MTRKVRIALWCVILVFAITLFMNLGTVMWGTLGSFRPGDPGVTDTTLPRNIVEMHLTNFYQGHVTMWKVMAIGTLVLLWLAIPVGKSDSPNEDFAGSSDITMK